MNKSITLNKRQVNDFELITNGSFHPLDGFMNKKDYLSCISVMTIEKGFFPIPITLCITQDMSSKLKDEKEVELKDETGFILGIMDISNEHSVYSISVKAECKSIFGCYDINHPYIQIMEEYQKNGLIYNIGGPIIKYEKVPHYDFSDIRLTPSETKEFFTKNGWKNIIGFQTRNPMHRSHFQLTKYALSKVDNSNLLIHPVVGETQECDVDYYIRVKCYKKIMNYYDANVAKLSLLPLSMRMAGPKECLLHALIRKNYGCTHFIVGRDHAGPSSKKQNGTSFFYPYEAQNLLLKYASTIGIIPIISKEIVYTIPIDQANLSIKAGFMPIDEVDKSKLEILNISGTELRRMLKEGDDIPVWYSYPNIVKELRKAKKTGICLYFVGLSGAGKSTLANYTMAKLKELTDKQVSLLDGDIVRLNLSQGLGFSKKDRSTNVRRIGYVASEIVKHNGIVICANIAPYEEDREFNRNLILQYGNYIEIYVKTDLKICEERDCKGLYKLAREGKIKEFTGISDPFEEPLTSELIINGNESIETILNEIFSFIVKYL